MSEPLTPEEAVDKALLYAFQLSNIDYQAIKNWRAPEAFIRALAGDGYTLTTLDAARASEGLDVERLHATLNRLMRNGWLAADITPSDTLYIAENIAREYAALASLVRIDNE